MGYFCVVFDFGKEMYWKLKYQTHRFIKFLTLHLKACCSTHAAIVQHLSLLWCDCRAGFGIMQHYWSGSRMCKSLPAHSTALSVLLQSFPYSTSTFGVDSAHWFYFSGFCCITNYLSMFTALSLQSKHTISCFALFFSNIAFIIKKNEYSVSSLFC